MARTSRATVQTSYILTCTKLPESPLAWSIVNPKAIRFQCLVPQYNMFLFIWSIPRRYIPGSIGPEIFRITIGAQRFRMWRTELFRNPCFCTKNYPIFAAGHDRCEAKKQWQGWLAVVWTLPRCRLPQGVERNSPWKRVRCDQKPRHFDVFF